MIDYYNLIYKIISISSFVISMNNIVSTNVFAKKYGIIVSVTWECIILCRIYNSHSNL